MNRINFRKRLFQMLFALQAGELPDKVNQETSSLGPGTGERQPLFIIIFFLSGYKYFP